MRTVSRLGILAAIVLWVVVTPAGAQTGAADQGEAAGTHNPYTPPPCVAGVPFADVTCSTFYDAWIEQFAADGITAGCGNGDYCPNENVTRAQMAVFIEAAMHGTANWSPGDLGGANTGLGAGALLNNSPYAQQNTAIGFNALNAQTFANGNVAYFPANTAVGFAALASNQPEGLSSGTGNTAVGAVSLNSNTIGYFNTAIGANSLFSVTTGSLNSGVGYFSLYNTTTGDNNTALGYQSLATNATGSYNIAIGYQADVASGDLHNTTVIGNFAVVDASDHVRIGNAQVTQIGGQVGWSNLSDVRAKTTIVPLGLGLDFVMALRPVSFTLKQGNGRTDLGFIAQDVEALLGDDYNVLGIGGDKDRTLSLRYTDFVAPIVKAIQEQQATIAALQGEIEALRARQAQIDSQKADIAALKAQVNALLAAQAAGAAKTAK
jgi:hypothetical protein